MKCYLSSLINEFSGTFGLFRITQFGFLPPKGKHRFLCAYACNVHCVFSHFCLNFIIPFLISNMYISVYFVSNF